MKDVPASLCCCIVLASLLGGCGVSPVRRPAAKLDPKPYLLHLPGITGGFWMHDQYCRALNAGGFDAETGIYDWTGSRFPISALQQRERNLKEAERVAAILTRKHRAEPDRPLYLSAESGGAGIAVWALERLPDDVRVDAVVLVSPAVSSGYDLSGALARVRRKMLVFPSRNDGLVLGFGTLFFGTMDRKYDRSAGLGGFARPARAEAAQYGKLEQYPYRGKMFWDYGNGGGHAWALYPRFASGWLAPRLIDLARWNDGDSAEDRPPSSPYSGERAGERGERCATSVIAGREDPHGSPVQPLLVPPRRSPLSPALSPAYRGEGEAVSERRRPI